MEAAKKEDSRRQDADLLKKYAARWAVLVAWQTELSRRSTCAPLEVSKRLEATKVKISSGCFSPCEIGCELRQIEAALTAADASSRDTQIDKWLDLLGRAMGPDKDIEELISVPVIGIYFNQCQSRSCACSH